MRSTAACLLLGATCALAAPGIANLTCPAGEVYGLTTLSANFPATFAKLQTVIGQFNNSDWQGLVQTSSAGAINAVGSSRVVAFGPFGLNETLQYISTTSNSSESVWTLVNGPIPASAAFNISSYQEDLVVNSTCGGAATAISWTVEYCFAGLANYSASVGGLFVGAHTGAVANITSLLGAGNFTSCAALSSNATASSTSAGAASSTRSASATGSSAAATTTPKSGATLNRMSASAIFGGVLSLVGFMVLA